MHTQTLYEAVCSDRNLCSKNLIESRDEITEMKRKLKIMSHQIDQLKEEIAAKVCMYIININMKEHSSIAIGLILSLPPSLLPPSSLLNTSGSCSGEEQHGPCSCGT